jgi:triphosphatase
MTLAEAAAMMAATTAATIADRWQQTLDHEDPAGPHHLRVALRRVRVVLHIFRQSDETGAMTRLRTALADLARVIAKLRDQDVLIEDIVMPAVGPVGSDFPVPGVDQLLEQLRHQRAQTWQEVRAALTTKPAMVLRRTLIALPTTLAATIAEADAADAASTIEQHARQDLQKRWNKIERRAKNLDGLSTTELHELRKALKNMRYAFAHFAPFWDRKAATAFEAQLRRLQSMFGYLNDVAGAQSLMLHTGTPPADLDLHCAIGFILGVHTERARDARSKITHEWQTLAGTKIARELTKG